MMAGALRLVLGDQLSRGLSSLKDIDPKKDHVLMVEVHDETTYVKHHKQKIVLILAAMRHFADELKQEGLPVIYVKLNDKGNSGSFSGEIARAIKTLKPEKIIMTEPGEFRVRAMMDEWQTQFKLPVEIRDDDRFFATPAEFKLWAAPRKELRMEFFYREMRKKSGLLMHGKEPEGGQWNYDSENRKALSSKEKIPDRLRFTPDAVTKDVINLVARRFADHPGRLESFGWPVTRKQALKALDHFINDCLPRFGDVQDAMKGGEPFLFHALLAPALNCGLLLPLEICRAAERAYHRGHAPLNAVEGFIRQILGWREYVRGLYWHVMPDYAQSNALEATRPLPAFYWTGDTEMNCLRQCVNDTMDNAYAHHIQRLMVLGNFALLAGIRPSEVEDWFLAVYADAYEWVELPNVHGMALYADGGLLASKPYAASGAYIDRMSDYCASCRFSPKAKEPERLCPFTPLYWAFLDRNRERLSRNPRLFMPYRSLDSMAEGLRARHLAAAEATLAAL
jgi:deoxyribodipyrimidine photolyase-related protein